MIATLCLNPSIDRTVQVDRFTLGATNRILSERSEGRGKGVNVAFTLKNLGLDVCCTGLLGEDNAPMIVNALKKAGVAELFIRQKGAVRTNLKIQDTATRTITELNEPGVVATEESLIAISRRVEEIAAKSEYLVLAGSLPPGCPNSIYRALMTAARRYGCKGVLDASGETFRDGLAGQPYLVKPNLQELEQYCGRSLSTLREIRDVAREIVSRGVRVVVVSMGAGGAMATDGVNTYYAPSAQVAVYSTVGAGDSMVAGLLKGFCSGGDLKEALRSGVAAASAAVSDPSGNLFPRELYDQFMLKVDVSRIQ